MDNLHVSVKFKFVKATCTSTYNHELKVLIAGAFHRSHGRGRPRRN
jgi:hypothetical protein